MMHVCARPCSDWMTALHERIQKVSIIILQPLHDSCIMSCKGVNYSTISPHVPSTHQLVALLIILLMFR